MRNRRGRKRKTGHRERNGRPQRQPADSPRVVAAGMPHRKGLGEEAVDQLAESELGRMVLRGELERDLWLAGETYAAQWRGYVSTLNAPQSLTNGQGRVSSCLGCPSPEDRKFCLCDLRRRIWQESARALENSTGRGVVWAVHAVVIYGRQVPIEVLPALRIGLSALACHFGLTKRGSSANVRNIRSPVMTANGHSHREG